MCVALLAMFSNTITNEAITRETAGVVVTMKLYPNTRGTYSAQGAGPDSVRLYAEGLSRADAREKWLAKYSERRAFSGKRDKWRGAA